jgi:hypothetical protein
MALEAAGSLLVASVAARVLCGQDVTRLLGVAERPGDHVPQSLNPEAARIGRTVSRVAGVLPWRPKCLRQAMATRWMLRRRGIPCEAHLGIVRTEPFEAHAWVTVEGSVVQGGPIGHATEIAVLR